MARIPVINTREKILNAALTVIRTQGYSATTVDNLCEAAGVTKGAFFHHFKSKEELAVEAANHWSQVTGEFFKTAPYQKIQDPLDRVLGYIDFRTAIIDGEIATFTCLVGTMVQEIHHTNPLIRAACEKSIFGHAETVAADIEAAKKRYAPNADWTSEEIGHHIQSVIQGAYILAKASQNPEIALNSLGHLRHYIEMLFKSSGSKNKKEKI